MIFDKSLMTKNQMYLVPQYRKEKHHFLDFILNSSFILISLSLARKKNIYSTHKYFLKECTCDDHRVM